MIDRKKLTAAFAALRKKGYFARQNFQCCQSCGWGAVPHDADKVVFYHLQSREDMLDGNGLYLSWTGDSKEIVKVLRDNGLTVKHNGRKNAAILVEPEPQYSLKDLKENTAKHPDTKLVVLTEKPVVLFARYNHIDRPVTVTSIAATLSEECGNTLMVFFDTKTWNVHKLGLLYYDDHFMKELRKHLNKLGWDARNIDYSESGLQGDNYVDCDIDGDLMRRKDTCNA